MTELDALDPIPETVKLESGQVVALEPLKARQFFKLLRILTRGALPNMTGSLQDLQNGSPEEITSRLLGMTLLSLPEAEDEAIDFIRAMCKPVGLIERRNLNKQDSERNLALYSQLYQELDNPSLDDLVTIVEAIIRRESADIQALGKRLSGMLKLADKTGQLSPTHPASTRTSSADSPEPSTSSPTNTDGTTSTSETFLSVDFDNASALSASAASTSGGGESNG